MFSSPGFIFFHLYFSPQHLPPKYYCIALVHKAGKRDFTTKIPVHSQKRGKEPNEIGSNNFALKK